MARKIYRPEEIIKLLRVKPPRYVLGFERELEQFAGYQLTRFSHYAWLNLWGENQTRADCQT